MRTIACCVVLLASVVNAQDQMTPSSSTSAEASRTTEQKTDVKTGVDIATFELGAGRKGAGGETSGTAQ